MVLFLVVLCVVLLVFFLYVYLVVYVSVIGFKFYFLVVMFVYSLLILLVFYVIFMGFIESVLYKCLLNCSLSSLFLLLIMELLLFRMLLFGFILLILIVGSGVFFFEELFGKLFLLDYKILFVFVLWGIFVMLLIGCYVWGWCGKCVLCWMLVGFVLLILVYVGSCFVVEVVFGCFWFVDEILLLVLLIVFVVLFVLLVFFLFSEMVMMVVNCFCLCYFV